MAEVAQKLRELPREVMPESVAKEVISIPFFTTTVYTSGEIARHGDKIVKLLEDCYTSTSISSGRYDTSEL